MTTAERDQVLEEIAPYLQHVAYGAYHSCSRFDIADCVQEGLLAACRALDRWDPDGGASPATYAKQRAVFAMLDFVRVETGFRHRVKIVPLGKQVLIMPDPRQGFLQEQVIAGDLGEKLLTGMSPRARGIFEAIADGATRCEIGRIQGVTKGRISQLISAARKDLPKAA